uniref:F-box domain-containing protein n=1 Tax=Brassica oleracea var. oleracea TaxID=109376 RepID=A0A0D3DTY6_BRAOL
MDAARVKPARSTNPPSEVDRLSSLPDCLIFQIFLNLPTKDVVQTSALSTRWTTLWKDVPGLDLDAEDFYIRETFVSFVDNFLERNHGLSIHRFKLRYDSFYFEEPSGLLNRWVDTAARLKVEHLDVSDNFSEWDPMMNPTGTSENPKMVNLIVIARPWSLLSSLEYVDIERPLKGEALEMTLVGYLLENLKKTVIKFA